MDRQAGLVLAWLEGEGQRRRRKAAVPAELGYAAWRGRAHLGACALWGALAAPLFVCWLAQAGAGPARVGATPYGTGAGITLEGARVEGIDPGPEQDEAPETLTLTVRHWGLLIPCEFRGAKVPRGVRVGDVVTVRCAGWRAEGETEPVLLRDCELDR